MSVLLHRAWAVVSNPLSFVSLHIPSTSIYSTPFAQSYTHPLHAHLLTYPTPYTHTHTHTQEEKYKEYRKEKKRERKRKDRGEEDEDTAELDPELSAMMGFSGFGAKKKAV